MRLILLVALFFVAFQGCNVRADPIPRPPAGHVVKVLPLFLDAHGRVAPSPSLFDRDAYQYYLLEHTNEISGVRFDVEWNAHRAGGLNLKLRLELRGIGAGGFPTQAVLERTVTPKWFHHWTSLTLSGVDYKKLGEVAAWHATLWDGNELLGEQKSFLWSL